MSSIIEELYNLFPDVNNYSTPERRKINEEYFRLRKRAEEACGRDLVDQLSLLHEQRLGYQGEDHFAAGVRAGVRLMAEVFIPSATE